MGINIEKNDKWKALISILVEKKINKEHVGGGKRKNKMALSLSQRRLAPTLLPLNADTQRIELSCIYRKLLKTI